MSAIAPIPNWLTHELRITIEHPSGYVLDVTDRISDVGSIREAVEEDLLQPLHGDIDFELDDFDGAVSSLIAGAMVDSVYTVEVWRDTFGRRSNDLLFRGVLDLPWSVSRNWKQRTVSLNVFSLTKILENVSAESLVRDFSALGTATATATQSSATVADTTNLASGDSVRIADDTNEETHVVEFVTGATTFRTRDAFSNSFSGATIEVTTPYPRWQTPTALATALVGLSPLPVGDVSLDRVLTPVPFISPANANGVSWSQFLRSIVETDDDELTLTADDVYVLTEAAEEGQYTGNVRDGFSGPGGASDDGTADWWPYLTDRPANFPTQTDGISDRGGSVAVDHTNDHVYTLVEDSSGPSTLTLYQDGSPIDEVASFFGTLGYTFYTLEYEPSLDQVWIAFRQGNGLEGMRIYDVGGGGVSAGPESVATSPSGTFRVMHQLGWMLWGDQGHEEIRVYDIATATRIRTLTIAELGLEDGIILYPWTFRYLGGHIVVTYRLLGRIRVAIWDASWGLLADYDFAPASASGDPLVGGFNHSEFGQMLVISNGSGRAIGSSSPVGHVMGVLSSRYAGVIAYADLDSTSVATALKELALLGLGFVRVDTASRAVSIVPRETVGTVVADLGWSHDPAAPLEMEERPQWEGYRDSVAVSGTTEDGSNFEEIVGTSDARRESISAKFATTLSVARAIAQAYRAVLSQSRRWREVRIEEDGTVYRPFDVVLLDGVRWLVLASDTDVSEREQRLELIEVVS